MNRAKIEAAKGLIDPVFHKRTEIEKAIVCSHDTESLIKRRDIGTAWLCERCGNIRPATTKAEL